MSDDNIDLYAPQDLGIGDIAFENSQENLLDSETDKIFNDVVTSRMHENEATHNNVLALVDNGLQNDIEDSYEDKEIASTFSRKFVVYVGNMTWWTTDLDIEDLLKSIGVDDVIEVKFFDNRGNGQSKGYCNVSVRSEASLKLIHERLHTKEIHGKKPQVCAPSKTAIAQFESQSKTRPYPPQLNQGNVLGPTSGPREANQYTPGMGVPQGFGMSGGPTSNRMMNSRGPVRNVGPACALSPSGNNGLHMRTQPHPSQQHFSPQRPPLLPRMLYRPHHQPIDRCAHPPNVRFGMRQPGPPPRGEWMRPPGPGHPYPPFVPPSLHSPHGPPGLPQPRVDSPTSGPSPHANPAFYPPHYLCPTDVRPPGPGVLGKGMVGSPTPISMPGKDAPPQRVNELSSPLAQENNGKALASPMTDVEIEDIMSRNRTVSSSAISRAVADAGSGDFASAIETLVTAISLIRQSKVAHEDRCKVLIASLQDTLHGIEFKSYGYGSHRGNHKRSRSRSRERERARHHRYRYYHRYGSRDRENFTRSRSHERERHYEIRRSSRSSSRGHESERSVKIDERDRYREKHERYHRVSRYRDDDERDDLEKFESERIRH